LPHPRPDCPEDCFGCKLRSINFGMVPGGYRDDTSTTMIDHESLKQSLIPTREEVEDVRSDLRARVAEATRGA